MSFQMRFLILVSFLLAFGCGNGGSKKSTPEVKPQVIENIKLGFAWVIFGHIQSENLFLSFWKGF